MLKEKYFLKKSHINIFSYFIFAYIALFIFVFFIFINNTKLFTELSIVLFVITLVLAILMRYYKTKGLYIEKDKVYYKNIKKYSIDTKNIKGIKIIRSYGAGGKYRGFFPLEDNKGQSLYTAVLLKDITDGMRCFEKGDLWFIQEFKEQIISSSIYCQEAVECLKHFNPNIEII